jgi:hypothetical protein
MFDALGAILATGGMLLLVYALVKAPTVGWGTSRTIGELAGALAVLAAFVVNESRQRLLGLRATNTRGEEPSPSANQLPEPSRA